MANTNQGGIDQVRGISGTIQFDQIHPRTRVVLPNADGGLVEDIVLSLHGGMNPYITVAGVPFRCPQGVKVGLFGTLDAKPYSLDLTESLLAELRDLLDSTDQQAASKAYETAMETWLQYAETELPSEYGPGVLAHDRQLVTTLASTKPLSKLLDRLGDRAVGIGGTLHLFNYLYDDIPLPGASLKKILAVKKTEIGKFSTIGLEFEHPVPAGGVIGVSGTAIFKAETIVHNPLRDQLADLEKTIVSALQDIEQKLMASGDIMQSLANAHDQLLALKTALDSFESRFASSLSELQQLKASVANLSIKIDGLH